MKPQTMSPLLLVTLGSVLFSSTQPAAAGEPTVSFHARCEIRSVLPDYSVADHSRAEAAKAAAASLASDPDVVSMAPVTVQASTLCRLEEGSFYRRGAFDRELVKRELSTFDRCFLNRFTLPLFGVTKEARARQAYLERKDRGFRRCFPGLARPVQATDQTDAAILRVGAVPWH